MNAIRVHTRCNTHYNTVLIATWQQYACIYVRVCMYVFTYVCVEACTGWRRLIGSPKLQIIFHKRATRYRSLLRKMTYKDKGSDESSPPRNITVLYFAHEFCRGFMARDFLEPHQWCLSTLFLSLPTTLLCRSTGGFMSIDTSSNNKQETLNSGNVIPQTTWIMSLFFSSSLSPPCSLSFNWKIHE